MSSPCVRVARNGRRTLVLATIFAGLSAPPSRAEDQPSLPDAIVVTGERERQAEVAADQAALITLPSRVDMPLARHYAPICIQMFGIDLAYGELLAQRVRDNAKKVGLPVGRSGCSANVWIGFARDSQNELVRLKREDPALFARFKSFEADRVFGGSGAAQLLHVNEVRGVDGRPIAINQIMMNGVLVDVKVNSQYQAGRLRTTIRTDIDGTLLIFDRQRADGRTVRQLADYATMRILAPLQDFATVEAPATSTVLHLFARGSDGPDGMTNFDWAYLSAYYKLDRGARAPAVHDAVRRAMLDGVGQQLSDKDAARAE